MASRRRCFTLEDKAKIVANYKKDSPGFGVSSVAGACGVSKSTLRGWISQKQILLGDLDRKRRRRRIHGGGRKAQLSDLEEVLYAWIKERVSNGIRIQDRDLQLKGAELFQSLQLEGSFGFSNGWVDNFKKRYNLVSRRCTTTRMVPVDAAQIAMDWIKRVRLFIEEKGIRPENIINIDQVPRYFQHEALSTLAEKGSKQVFLRKINSSHKRFTATFAITANGQLHLPHLLFSKLKKRPKCNPGTIVDVNQSGMWNMDILTKYVQDWVPIFVGSNFNEEDVLIILDSYACHIKLAKEAHLRHPKMHVWILPANMTPLMQPLDVSLNRSFQAHYDTKITHFIGQALRDQRLQTKNGSLKMPPYNLVSEWVKEWSDSVPPDMVRKAFKIVGLGSEPLSTDQLHQPLRDLLERQTLENLGDDQLLDDWDVFEMSCNEGANDRVEQSDYEFGTLFTED